MATEEDKIVQLVYNLCANFSAYLRSNLLFIYQYEQVVYVSETSFLSTVKEGLGKNVPSLRLFLALIIYVKYISLILCQMLTQLLIWFIYLVALVLDS